ncbi:MAG: hypothetical protein K0S08_1095 [Gammaproteobacteria bacterium]|jgi:hypothetical protein|nr:hypothetical protein [Gammaproteobacteria bacterium]
MRHSPSEEQLLPVSNELKPSANEHAAVIFKESTVNAVMNDLVFATLAATAPSAIEWIQKNLPTPLFIALPIVMTLGPAALKYGISRACSKSTEVDITAPPKSHAEKSAELAGWLGAWIAVAGVDAVAGILLTAGYKDLASQVQLYTQSGVLLPARAVVGYGFGRLTALAHTKWRKDPEDHKVSASGLGSWLQSIWKKQGPNDGTTVEAAATLKPNV